MVDNIEKLVEDVKFGVLMLGAPGAGKSTLAKVLSEHLDTLDRPHCLVNLDAANEDVGYKVGVDVRDLITLEDAMTDLQLGPNGGTLYCAEFLLQNFNWLCD
jgi:GPN-loop GTPase